MTKRFSTKLCCGWIAACCLAQAAGAQCLTFAALPVSQADAPTEVETTVANQWLTANGAKANLAALDAYTKGDPAGGERALASLLADARLKKLFVLVASGKNYGDTVATAGIEKMAAADSDGALFGEAKTYIGQLYTGDGSTVAALSNANDEIQANHSLRALSILLSAVPQAPVGGPPCNYDWIARLRIFQASYQRSPSTLLGYVTDLFKVKKSN